MRPCRDYLAYCASESSAERKFRVSNSPRGIVLKRVSSAILRAQDINGKSQ
jgi:hypothetical protein